MRRQFHILPAAMLLALCPSTAFCQEPIESVTKARVDLDLTFQISGKVKTMPVAPGTSVKAGHILLQLEDDVAAAWEKRFRVQAESKVSIEAAEAELALSEKELTIAKGLHEEGALSSKELDLSKLQVHINTLKLRQAKVTHDVASADYEIRFHEHALHTLKAPVDGVVELVTDDDDRAREVSIGESVKALVPVLRLVMDKVLFVDVALPTGDASNLKVGDKAWVRAAIPEHTQEVEGKIIHISRVSDPATITNIVRVEIPNENRYLQTGWHVKVYLQQHDDTYQTVVENKDQQPK